MFDRCFLLPLGLLGTVVAGPGSAAPDCEAISQQIASGQKTGLDQRIIELSKHEDRCSGSGFYEYYLGVLYANAGNHEAALQSLARAQESELPLEYRRSVGVTLADILAVQGSARQAEEQYRRAAAAYPNWYWGQYSLVYLVKRSVTY